VKSIPRLERELREEVESLRAQFDLTITKLTDRIAELEERNLSLVRAISDETIGPDRPPVDLSGF